MDYFGTIKSLHIIFVVTWFAGLFYGARLFIYYAETKDKPSPEKEILQKQYRLMTKRLWYIIAWPSAIITLCTASLMLIERPVYLEESWMQVKLGFVAALYIYFILSHQIFKQNQNNIIKYSSGQLRLWNEVATNILFAVVFLVVLKSTVDWIFGVVGILGLMILLMLGVKLYKKIREKKGES